jgi:hypothetical protein
VPGHDGIGGDDAGDGVVSENSNGDYAASRWYLYGLGSQVRATIGNNWVSLD